MYGINKEEQVKAVKGWWNSSKSQKWDKKYDNYDAHSMKYLNFRQGKILEYIDQLGLGIDAKVLELGYGAGQTALKLVQKGFDVHGIDVSEKFCKMAEQRCREGAPQGKFYFKTGNLESKLDYEKDEFDLVLVSGVLQYLYDPNVCIEEIHRVLKPGRYFIVAQKNAYSLVNITSFRKLARRFIYFILREKYELFPSFKAILIDSKLGFFFRRFENSKLFNSKFMLKGHQEWNYKLRKRLIYYSYLKSFLLKKGFAFLKADGVYYTFSENPQLKELDTKVDIFFTKLMKKRFTHFLFTLAETITILSQKKLEQNKQN